MDIDREKLLKELKDILVFCEKGKEYHQAIINLKCKIENGEIKSGLH